VRARITRAEALHAYTCGAAHAAFAEARRGSVSEGLDADLTVFAEDLLAVPSERLPEVAVLGTIVGGRVEHDAGL